MDRSALLVLGAALAFVMWRISQGQGGATAGDEQADLLTDTYDTMKSTITGWPAGSEPYQDTIQEAADDSGVPVSILAWLLWKESRYNPRIIDGTIKSRVGALGIAQFMPATAADLGVNPLDPADAIPGAARYLANLYRSTGTWAQALASYDWGIGNVRRKGIDAAPAETVDYYTSILSKAGYEATA
ncbi:MAG: transglycosylase SLT domain-containing protein [Xanthobacteraceae bacterium]